MPIKLDTQSNRTKHFQYETLTPKNITETQNIRTRYKFILLKLLLWMEPYSWN